MTILIDLQSLLTFGLFASVSCFDDDFVRYSTLMMMMMVVWQATPPSLSLPLFPGLSLVDLPSGAQ